jgi:hypothetical protein
VTTCCRRGSYPEPFTLDFVVTRQTPSGLVYQARSMKTPEDAGVPKVRLRLKVEHRWRQQNGIDWKLVDTTEYSRDLLSTLTFMRGWTLQRYVPKVDQADESRMFADHYGTNCKYSGERAVSTSFVPRAHSGPGRGSCTMLNVLPRFFSVIVTGGSGFYDFLMKMSDCIAIPRDDGRVCSAHRHTDIVDHYLHNPCLFY